MNLKVTLYGMVGLDDSNETLFFNRDYFERVFVKPLENGTQLSTLSMRLAGLLIFTLDSVEPRKLPARSYLAERLEVSKTSITNSLTQLVDSGFILVTNSNIQKVPMAKVDEDGNVSITVKTLISGLPQKKFTELYALNRHFNNPPTRSVLREILGFSADTQSEY